MERGLTEDSRRPKQVSPDSTTSPLRLCYIIPREQLQLCYMRTAAQYPYAILINSSTRSEPISAPPQVYTSVNSICTTWTEISPVSAKSKGQRHVGEAQDYDMERKVTLFIVSSSRL